MRLSLVVVLFILSSQSAYAGVDDILAIDVSQLTAHSLDELLGEDPATEALYAHLIDANRIDLVWHRIAPLPSLHVAESGIDEFALCEQLTSDEASAGIEALFTHDLLNWQDAVSRETIGHYALTCGRQDLIATILQNGFNATLRSIDGQTVLRRAIQANMQEAADAMIAHILNAELRNMLNFNLQTLIDALWVTRAQVDEPDQVAARAARLVPDVALPTIRLAFQEQQRPDLWAAVLYVLAPYVLTANNLNSDERVEQIRQIVATLHSYVDSNRSEASSSSPTAAYSSLAGGLGDAQTFPHSPAPFAAFGCGRSTR